MSRTVENRIVEMQFQNKQFESAVAQSRQSIQLLEKDLKLLEGVQALKNIDTAVQSIDVSGIAKGIETLNDRFSTLGIIGMTVTQNLTNGFMGLVTSGLRTAASSVTGLFNNIMNRGMNRAKNIEQAKFSLMGLLQDEAKVQEVFDLASDSVDGTAYALDSAAKAASTLVATYGSDVDGLNKVNKALRGIVGVAAQTNHEYEGVAQIFTTVAGNGRVMGMQLTQLATYGLNAAAAIAEYLNQADNKKIRQKLGVGKWASEAEVRDLVSKGKITAEMFSEAFEPFYENAEKANSTLDGIISNINAALGRIGADFISPLIEQDSPLIKFLQKVRILINGIRTELNEFKIPENVTSIINLLLGYAEGALGEIDIGEFSIFKNIGNITGAISKALKITYETDKDGNKILYNEESRLKEYESVYNSFFRNNLKNIRQAQQGTIKSFDEYFNDLVSERYGLGEKVLEVYKEHGDEWNYIMGIPVDKLDEIKREAISKLASANREIFDPKYSEEAAILAEEQTDRYMRAFDIWHTDYIDNIIQSVKNIKDIFSSIGGMIDTAVTGLDGPIKNFWNMITGKSEDISGFRILINGVTGFIKESTEKIKNYLTDNEDIQGVINGVVGVFNILGKTVNAVWTIFKNAYKSFEPLIGKIIKFLGAIGDSIYDISKSDETIDGFGVAIRWISDIIDGLAKGLEFLWDTATNFINDVIGPENIYSNIEKLGKYLKIIGEYIGTNLPIWIEKAKPYVEWFGKKILEVAKWIKEKLGEAFNLVSPYIDTFVGWLSEATGGAVDLTKPLETVNTVLENTEDVAGSVSTAIDGISTSFGAASVGLGAPAKLLNGLAGSLVNLSDKKGALNEFASDSEVSADKMLTPWEKVKKTMGMVLEVCKSGIWKALDKFGISKDLRNTWDSIKEFFKGIKDNFKNLDVEKVTDIIGGILGIVTKVFTTFVIGKSTLNVTSAIKRLPKTFESISMTVRSFSPFYADVMKADNKTTRREAMANILKSFAGVLLSLAVAVGVMVGAIHVLGNMDPNVLNQGMMALGQIMIPIIGIIAVLALLMCFISGNDHTSVEGDEIPGIEGMKGFKKLITILKNGGLKSSTKTVTSQGANTWKSVAAIAASITAFAVAIGLITLAIWGFGSMDPDKLNQGMVAFYQVAGALIILMALLGAFAAILRGGQNSKGKSWDNAEGLTTIGNKGTGWIKGASKGQKNRFSEVNDADWKVIAAMGVALLLISGAITGIMAAIAIVANVPMKNLDKSLEVFREVVIAIGLLMVILGVFASIMTLFNRNTSKSIAGPLIAMAVILGIVMGSIMLIMQMLVEIAVLPIKPEKMDAAIEMFKTVADVIEGLIKTIGTIIIIITLLAALGSTFGSNGDKFSKSLGSIALVIATLSVLFLSIGASFILLAIGVAKIAEAISGLNESQLGAIIAIVGIFTGLVLIVMGSVIAMMWISTYVDVSGKFIAMLAVVGLMFLEIGALFLSIGFMAKLIGESGVSEATIVTIVGVVTVLVGLIMVCVTVILALMSSGIGEAAVATIAVLGAMFLSLGVLFAAIGVAAVGVGYGLTLITDALIKFINFFAEEMSEEKTGKVTSNLERFLYALGTIIFAGLLGVAAFLDTNKQRVVDAIKKIVSFILEAIWASFVQTFESNLDGLTQIIELLDLWIKNNKFEIERIIMNLGEILYHSINVFMDNIMKLILGENYDGGTDGLLGQLTNGIINWLYTYFLNEDAVGRTLLNDLFVVLGETAHQGILDFLQLIIDSQDIPTKALEAVDSVIVGITTGLITYGPKIIDDVKELLRVVWQLILYTLGISDVPPQSAMFGVTGGTTKGNPEGVAGEMGDKMSTGLTNYNWTTGVKNFLRGLWNKILDFVEGVEEIAPGCGGLIGLGKQIADKICEGIGIGGGEGSPWSRTERSGRWAIEGLANGIRDRSENNKLLEAARNVSTAVVSSISGGIDLASSTSPIMSGFTREFNNLKNRLSLLFNPLLEGIEAKITPYMDLSQIQEGFGSIQNMMDGNSEFDISAINSNDGSLNSLSENLTDSGDVTIASEGFDEINMPGMDQLGSLTPETILNFTQNNYSPESLSRIDIYRDTRNMLSNPALRSIIGLKMDNNSGGGGGYF